LHIQSVKLHIIDGVS